MAAHTATVLRLSLRDIAQLARVQRPVVSVWRTRSAGGGSPFPAPIATELGQEWFDAAEIVDWLEATGRGNNPDARQDAAAFASLQDSSPVGDEQVFHGLTALLCLAAASGGALRGMDAADVLDLADEHDPDDECLYAEIDALGERLDGLVRYAGLLVDAAFSPVAAFEKLMSERFRLHVPGQTAVALTTPTLDLVAAIAIGMADQAGIDMPTFVDPTGGGSDLLIALAEAAEDPRVVEVATAPGNGAAARLARRRLWVHDLHRVALVADSDGGYLMPDSAVVVAQYPWAGAPTMSNLEILAAVNDLALQTTDAHRVVIIAPAAALTDQLRTHDEKRLRDGLLRTERIRALVRLPAGSVTTRPTQRLALCCLGTPAPGADPERRAIRVGDLANATLDAGTIDNLVTEVRAAMDDQDGFRGHATRFLRPVVFRILRARLGDLVAPGPAAPDGMARGAELVLRIQAKTGELAEPVSSAALPTVEVRESEAPRLLTTLGAAVARGEIRILPGHRLDPTHLTIGDGVPIIGAQELTGAEAVGGRTIDRLVLAARYPAGNYTEPGDVVFCTSPPLARVDIDGGSVVAYPARVIRINRKGSGILPRVLAADISAMPERSPAWRAWTIRTVANDQADALNAVLADIDTERANLAARIEALTDCAALLTQGAANGTLTLSTAVPKGQ